MSSEPSVQSTSADYVDERRRARVLSSGHLWLLLVAVVTALICAPFFRVIFGAGGDEGVLLNGAERMLNGSTLYSDFFEFLPPGGFFLVEAWFRIAGVSFASVRLLAVLTIVGTACLTYLTSRQVSKNAPLSAMLAIWWAVTSQGYLTQISHNWFATLFSMATLWSALASTGRARRDFRWTAGAGVAAGMAAMITPHRGVLALLAAATPYVNLRLRRPEFGIYALGCALAPFCVLLYLVGHHALGAAFSDVVQFTIARYASINSEPFGYGGQTAFKYVFPFAALLTVLVCVHEWRACVRDRYLWLCAAFGLAGAAGCFPRADTIHISYTVPLVCPLLAYCTTRLAQRWRPKWWRYRYVAAAIAGIIIGLCVPSIDFFLWMSREALRAETVLTPRGSVRIVLVRPELPKVIAKIETTPPEDTYFFYPVPHMLPFLTAREQVSRYDYFMPQYTLPSQYQDACISVMKHASWVVLDRHWMDSQALKHTFPAMQDTEPRERIRFERALNDGFEFIGREGEFEFRHRLKGVSDSLCAGIAE